MIFIKKRITQEQYNELNTQGRRAILDFGFEYLYNNKIIDTDRQYKGAKLIEQDGNYYLSCRTLPKNEVTISVSY